MFANSKAFRTVILAGGLLGGLTSDAWAQTVTLKEAAQEAVRSNPEVLARWHAFRAATENIDVIRGGLRPRVDLSANVARERQDNPALQDSYTRSGLSLYVDQILFDGTATRNEVSKFNYVQRVRFYELLDTTESTALEAMRAYTDVQRYRSLHRLAQENYAQHRAVFEQIQHRVKSGVGRRVDLEQAGGRLALAESNLLTEASNLHDVSVRYQRLVGQLPTETLADIPVLATGLPEQSDQALRLAYAQNPGLAAAQENIVAAQNDAKTRHAKFLPRVDLRARHDFGRNLDGVNGTHNLTNVELLLNYNLYNGGSDQAAERQYWEQVNVAKDLRDKTCRDIRQTLYIAYNDVKRLKEQLIYLEQHQLSIEKARDAYRKQFDIGQRTLLDLLDTENELFQARRAYQIAYYDHLFAMGRTQAAMGNLLAALGLQRLETPNLVNADEKAAFDPDAICPADAPLQMRVDKEKVFAEALATAASSNPVAVAGTMAPSAAPSGAAVADRDGDGVTDDKDLCADSAKGVKVDARGCPLTTVIELNGVNFEYNSCSLRPDAFPLLDEAVRVLQRYPRLTVEVAGHSDNIGDADFNLRLSESRANAVRDYLMSQGVAAARLSAKGYGEQQPIADNGTEAGQAKNRRVELRILNK